VSETRVSTLELFFDLVFVFTVTQLTAVLVEHPNGDGLAQVAVMLAFVWWMYAGYSWLTNSIDVEAAADRLFLLAAMAAWLVLALALPQAFSSTGFTFGAAYLVIIVVHAGLFTHATSEVSARSMLGVAPSNVACAAAIVAGGAIGGTVQWVVWSVSAVALWAVPRLRATGVFELQAAHFVERHGLVIIVALGESVVAIGIGASGLAVDLELVAVAVVGLLLVAGLWWTYFSDERAIEEAMVRADAGERTRMALNGFAYPHWFLLLGIVLVAAALRKATGHPFDAASTAAAVGLGGGVAIFLAADAVFRHVLGIAGARPRACAALLAPLSIPIGLAAAGAQIAALVALLTGLVLSRRPLRRAARGPRPASPRAPRR
jgi:low temperature requirement protein LtrA